ncbi:hypothetical protein BBJ28_00009844 [Nothophytophthora sp. Chile5]|nr:hypothetical protein BBJ28_00009844 [Nothophytophthora sp. Chile5]
MELLGTGDHPLAVGDEHAKALLPQTADAAGLKRTGRPVHPLWAHFHRGEKRNRYHYHAFCSYCVARHGVGQVAPTRGVSTDMLRHLESCPNCPRKVVEAVKELCGRRERHAHAKKQAASAASSSSATENVATAAVAEPGVEQPPGQINSRLPVKRSAREALIEETVASTAEELQAASDAVGNAFESETDRLDAGSDGTGRLSSTSEIAKRAASRGQSRQQGTRSSVDAADGGLFLASPAKRGRTDSGGAEGQAGERDIPTTVANWQMALLQATVAAGLPLSVFQRAEFQELLQVLSPVQVEDKGAISNIGSQSFLEETAAKLARGQLDRVKEGMLNSTIKGGLTLSVTCWRTLDLQQLVAFALVNSNGDAACVRVEELDGRQQQQQPSTIDGGESDSPMALLLPLASAIEDVLLELNGQNICVMGIVADSAVALSAAKRVCHSSRWRGLLVVPCISALLMSLAGNVLTHEAFRDAVGQLVELAAYFSNARLLAALRAVSGEHDAHIPLPTRTHWFSFVTSLSKALHYSDAITAICSGEDDDVVPAAVRELVLGSDGQLWKTLRELAVLLAPLREAYSLVFQSKPTLGETTTADDEDDGEVATVVHGGLTLAHVMYQLGRMSQQYAELSEAADAASNSVPDADAVAHRLHELLDTMWQRYDLPAMVLAFVFDFHLDTARLDMSSSALQWKAVASYFQLYFQRWFGPSQENEGAPTNASTLLAPISSHKVEEILNAYQLRQFPFDADTTSDYADVSSFYSFVSDSHPEICALCCRVYAIALASADVRRVIRGVGFVPTVAQTTERPEQVELLLHVGFASSLKKTSRPAAGSPASSRVLTDLQQANRPEELLCSQEAWEAFAADWRLLLDHELEVDELEQLQQLHSHDDKDDGAFEAAVELRLPLDQLFFEALPPLPAAGVVAPSPHDPAGSVTHTSVLL